MFASTPSAWYHSSAGQLPAIERDADVAGAEPDEFAAAQAVIAYAAKHACDLDASLTAAQRAGLLAFSSLVHGRLDVATDVCMWLEPRGFAEHRKVGLQPGPWSDVPAHLQW